MSARRILIALMMFMVMCVTSAEAQQAKKKDSPREGAAGDRDSKDDVRGAIWEVTATKVEDEEEKKDDEKTDKPAAGTKKKNAKSKGKEDEEPKREVFRFRHQTGVVYDLKGDKIGALSQINADPKFGIKSRLVLNKSTPLIGEMVMTQSKIGVWGGVFKTKTGEQWNCVIKVLDR